MVCHFDCQYLYHSLLPAVIDFLSQSDENFCLQSGIEKSTDELIFCVDREWHLGHENSQSKASDFNLTK